MQLQLSSWKLTQGPRRTADSLNASTAGPATLGKYEYLLAKAKNGVGVTSEASSSARWNMIGMRPFHASSVTREGAAEDEGVGEGRSIEGVSVGRTFLRR